MRILVVGDLIRDVSVRVNSVRPSAEGVPTFETDFFHPEMATPGGAGLVALHCAVLGAKVAFFHQAFLTDTFFIDEDARVYPVECHDLGVDIPETKLRVYRGNEKVFKLNSCDRRFYNEEYRNAKFEQLDDVIKRFRPDLILACEYGPFLRGLERRLLELAVDVPVWVDAQFSGELPDFSRWIGASSIFLNHAEFHVIGPDLGRFPEYHHKMGALGSLHVKRDPLLIEKFDALAVDAKDPVGAGDAYLAGYAVTRDMRFANAWAALSTTRIGTAVPPLSALKEIDASLIGLCERR